MIDCLQLEHPDTNDLPGNEDPRDESDEIRRVVQDVGVNPEEGERWQRAKL